MIGVIESMVAAPIVAIGLMHPEGHEAFGKAEQGIMLMLNVFLRPSMMIIGLITGIMLSYVGLWLINAGISAAVSAVLDSLSGIGFIWFPAGIAVIYMTIVISLLNKVFSLIYIIPDKILRLALRRLSRLFGFRIARRCSPCCQGRGARGRRCGRPRDERRQPRFDASRRTTPRRTTSKKKRRRKQSQRSSNWVRSGATRRKSCGRCRREGRGS